MASLKVVAYHEAGHAVAAWRFGYPIELVSIIPGEDFFGVQRGESPLSNMHLDTDDAPEVIQAIEQEIIIRCAGEVAQKRFDPQTWEHHHGEQDRFWINELLPEVITQTSEDVEEVKRRTDEEMRKREEGLPPSRSLWSPEEGEARTLKRHEQEQTKLVELTNEAVKLIDQHWHAVEAMACALLENKELSGAEATRLLEKVTGEVMPRSTLFDYINDINTPPEGRNEGWK